jgi:heme-degrading monooxygenase HmoA
MSIMHEVEDYSSWKAVFDHAAGIRKEAGEIVYQLLHYDRDANTIVHLSEWPSLHNARRFFESPELSRSGKNGRRPIPQVYLPPGIERGGL